MTSIRDSLWEYRRRFAATIAKQRLNNRNFTIVSNNCWGAEAYRELGLQYQTPFVGLAVFAPCYLKLVQDLPTYMGQTLHFTKESRYREVNESWVRNPDKIYPVGILGEDIEIHFIHYNNSIEAYEKWSRRSDRVDWNNSNRLFFKFCDHDYCDSHIIEEFNNLNYKNKIFFTSRNLPHLDSTVWIKECENLEHVVDGYSLYFQSKKYFDVINWLNGDLSNSNWQFEILKRFKLT